MNRENGLIYTANAANAVGAKASAKMDFTHEDRAPVQKLNVILWKDAMGDKPVPGQLMQKQKKAKKDDDDCGSGKDNTGMSSCKKSVIPSFALLRMSRGWQRVSPSLRRSLPLGSQADAKTWLSRRPRLVTVRGAIGMRVLRETMKKRGWGRFDWRRGLVRGPGDARICGRGMGIQARQSRWAKRG